VGLSRLPQYYFYNTTAEVGHGLYYLTYYLANSIPIFSCGYLLADTLVLPFDNLLVHLVIAIDPNQKPNGMNCVMSLL
jgi:hypothetical protein